MYLPGWVHTSHPADLSTFYRLVFFRWVLPTYIFLDLTFDNQHNAGRIYNVWPQRTRLESALRSRSFISRNPWHRKNNELIKAPVSVVKSWMITIRNIMMSEKTDCGCSMILVGIDHVLRRGRIIVSSLNSWVSMIFPWTIYLFFCVSPGDTCDPLPLFVLVWTWSRDFPWCVFL